LQNLQSRFFTTRYNYLHQQILAIFCSYSCKNKLSNHSISDRSKPFDKIPYKSREVSRHETIALQTQGVGMSYKGTRTVDKKLFRRDRARDRKLARAAVARSGSPSCQAPVVTVTRPTLQSSPGRFPARTNHPLAACLVPANP